MKSQRRAFLSTLAALPLLPFPSSAANAQPAPPPGASPANPVSAGLLAAARAQYELTPAEADEVRKGIDQILGAAEQLRAVPLVNPDEPVLVFEARPAASGRR